MVKKNTSKEVELIAIQRTARSTGLVAVVGNTLIESSGCRRGWGRVPGVKVEEPYVGEKLRFYGRGKESFYFGRVRSVINMSYKLFRQFKRDIVERNKPEGIRMAIGDVAESHPILFYFPDLKEYLPYLNEEAPQNFGEDLAGKCGLDLKDYCIYLLLKCVGISGRGEGYREVLGIIRNYLGNNGLDEKFKEALSCFSKISAQRWEDNFGQTLGEITLHRGALE